MAPRSVAHGISPYCRSIRQASRVGTLGLGTALGRAHRHQECSEDQRRGWVAACGDRFTLLRATVQLIPRPQQGSSEVEQGRVSLKPTVTTTRRVLVSCHASRISILPCFLTRAGEQCVLTKQRTLRTPTSLNLAQCLVALPPTMYARTMSECCAAGYSSSCLTSSHP